MESSQANTPPPARIPGASVRTEKRVPLTDLTVGRDAIICETQCDREAADMLCAMGLRPNACIRLMRCGRPCIVHVMGRHGCCCRIGLQARLAKQILVEPMAWEHDRAQVKR